MRKILLILVGTLVYMSLYAQFTTGTTGLLNMPTAEMQRDKTFMFGGGFFGKTCHTSTMDIQYFELLYQYHSFSMAGGSLRLYTS